MKKILQKTIESIAGFGACCYAAIMKMPSIIAHTLFWQSKPNRYEGDVFYQSITSDMGELFVAETEQGICQMGFVAEGRRDEALKALEKCWPNSFYHHQPLRFLPKSVTRQQLCTLALPLHLAATPFQQQVWEHLLLIPVGQVTTYGAIARRLGKARASQAVGQAVGANPLAIVIPCHRVLGADGSVGHYHWGTAMKKRLLEAEKLSG